ncbi:uncharacterized, partial [Tachysurus ichikawai]
ILALALAVPMSAVIRNQHKVSIVRWQAYLFCPPLLTKPYRILSLW